MRKILVSGASGIVGYGILRSLRGSGDKFTLIGCTIYEDSVAAGFCDFFEKAVKTNSEGYLEWLIGVIKKHKIDLIIPGIEPDLYNWNKNLRRLEEVGVKVLMNNSELLMLSCDKWAFYLELQNRNLTMAIPTSLEADFDRLKDLFGLPLLLKPRCGFGSKGIVKVPDCETFQRYRAKIGEELMVQPFVGSDDEEYTVAAFGDGGGGVAAQITLRRKLSEGGFTEKAEVVEDEVIQALVVELCRQFRPIGPTNFQFRKHDGAFKLLEINPRISSSTSIRAAFGYNESLMSVEFFLEDRLPSQPIVRRGRAVRYWEDCLFFAD